MVSPLCGALCALSLGVHHQGLGVDKGPEKTCFPKSIASSLIQPFSDLFVCGDVRRGSEHTLKLSGTAAVWETLAEMYPVSKCSGLGGH